MRSRKNILFACGMAVMVMALLFRIYGYEPTWHLWSIDTMSPHFADLYGLLAGAQSRAQGFDPMTYNPGDPWQRKVNYPRAWQILYSFGFNEKHTTFLGVIFIALFLTGVCFLLPCASVSSVTTVMAALLSPAALLGLERGNVDILMFFLVCLAIVTVPRSPVFAALAVFLGYVLKIFPVFACAIFLRESRTRFFAYMAALLFLAILYIFLTYSDIELMKKAAPQGTLLTYGLNVVWMGIGSHHIDMGPCARILSYLVAFSSLFFALSALRRTDFPSEATYPAIYLDAFRGGAAIYAGTFVLNNNWNYRLMFLILVIPQLTMWLKCRARCISSGSLLLLAGILFSMWHLVIIRAACYLPYGCYVSFALDQLAHWMVFAGLLYLFFWSMPDWLKQYAKKT